MTIAQLRFGRCWERDWAKEVGTKNTKASASAEFEFEAYVVPRAELARIAADERRLSGLSKAQMTWKPGAATFAAALSEDLRRILPEGSKEAFLLRSAVTAARSTRGASTERATVDAVTSITDSLGASMGALANPDENDPKRERNRIDETWPRKLDELSQGMLTDAERAELHEAFRQFRRDYAWAIGAMTEHGGAGLSSAAHAAQARAYGALLKKLRGTARADVLVRELWEPLLQVGTATVRGGRPALIVTPWHPLRLLEMAAKACQAAEVIGRIVTSTSVQSTGVEDYVKDRIQALRETYYADVGLLRTGSGLPNLLSETEARAGYSLLQPPFSARDSALADEPVKHTVQKFGEIAKHYLDQRPHDRANFSAVLLDAESEELPVLVANHLAKQIEDEKDLRCDLTVTHEDPRKLREIYERQNRRIGHEIESSLTSEAARIFMSRLRVGIASPQALSSRNGTKGQDILLLHDVIARRARLAWHGVLPPRDDVDLLRHVPSDVSRRKTQSLGKLTTSVYLTSPSQPAESQAYLDALHDALRGSPSAAWDHFIPAQEVELGSREIAEKLATAHQIANWVITYDRIADRRLIARADDRLRILRYFSTPRSLHNVIVSTEFSRDFLRDRLREDMERVLPGHDTETLDSLVAAIYRRSARLSGGIVMRGAHWDNYARELIGVIVAQREIELLLGREGERRTAMFFLDEFREWLDLSGEMSDILAVDLYATPAGAAKLRLVVVEAKCVGEDAASQSRNKSWAQLEETYAAVVNRFADHQAAVDPAIWRNRLADMLIEHMDAWGERDTVGGVTFDRWLEAIRGGRLPIEVSGHSIVAVHDKANSAPDLDLRVADPEKARGHRRRLAQWSLGADRITRSIRGIAKDVGEALLHEPGEWLGVPPAMVQGRPAGTAAPEAVAPGSREAPVQARPAMLTEEGPEADGAPEARATADVHVSRDSELPDAFAIDAPSSGPSRGTSGPEEASVAPLADIPAAFDCDGATVEEPEATVPQGWKPEVHAALAAMSRMEDQRRGLEWLAAQVRRFRQALQAENMDAPVEGARLTPNTGLLHVGGQAVTVGWLERRQTDLMTRYGIEIVRIAPQPGRIAVALKRPERAILHLSDAWMRRKLEASAPETNMALVLGEQEDDGELFYLSLAGDFAGHERAAPHTLVSGTTGSGKGILTANLILDICAFNGPHSVEVHLIDPKRGADYLWARDLPHLRAGIVEEKDAAVATLRRLVQEMEDRYVLITQAGCANLDQYNRRQEPTARLPRVVIVFDEVANWMQDDEFKDEVDGLINEIATKSRAAGLHLFMIYQRADNQVMTMQLRTNLGNKLILRLGDEGSSKIALGEKGAERLLGKGHVIAKLGTDDKIYGQVPFIGEDEVVVLAEAIKRAWAAPVVAVANGVR